jgi:hypothetical protein
MTPKSAFKPLTHVSRVFKISGFPIGQTAE